MTEIDAPPAVGSSVLPFVRGIDLSRYDFSGDQFPSEVRVMNGLRWLKLNHNNIDRVPDELSHLADLEHLQMAHNELTSVHGELSDMPRLRSVIVRHNKIKTAGIPSDIFQMKDLTLIDFSHNSLKDVPPNVERAKCAIVLNLSHNTIDNMPNQIFVNLVDLLHLDVSSNRLSTIPPQLRRLTALQVLNLSDNPLGGYQLKQLPSLTALRTLHMKSTQRTDANVPDMIDSLPNLEDVDFSDNELTRIPDSMYGLPKLRKLNCADNKISEIRPITLATDDTPYWETLQTLNLCRNQLKALPDAICKMTNMKMLLVNDNLLDFNGIPASIGKLVKLEKLHFAFNNLELVPEGIGRCVKLKKIKLNNNRLITLPDSVHLLPDLKELDVRNNPSLVMPPKPSEKRRLQYYNIDFSLQTQLKIAGQQSHHGSGSSIASGHTPLSESGGSRDAVARKIQFLKRRHVEANSDERKILQGMAEVAKERTRAEEALAEEKSVRPKRWDETLKKQKIDYSVIFDDTLKIYEGMTVWEIENFYPVEMDDCLHGKFYEGDCYIVLNAFRTAQGTMDYQIYYWIGELCTIDKKACSAIHSVALRDFLGATCRTIREDMNDESDEFIELFGEEIVYIDGGRTSSGFYTVEATTYVTRLYRIIERGIQVYAEPVHLTSESLDPRFVFLLDAGLNMFVWCGRKSKAVLRSKTRLFAEKMNRNERKGAAEIEMENAFFESLLFWNTLTGIEARPKEPIVEHVSSEYQPVRPKLYHVRLGMGYLELPQMELADGKLKQSCLSSKCVYVLDCDSDVFLWIGNQSTRLVRAAGHKLVTDLHSMIARPSYAQVHRALENREPMVCLRGLPKRNEYGSLELFKSKFYGWDDVIAVDFTRTADSVQRRGADTKVIMERDKMKTDLAALFLDRQQTMPDEEADALIEECNEDLEAMEPFVLQGRKFVRLPESEFGVFYSCDCYVFLCRYWVPPEDGDEGSDGEKGGDDKADTVSSSGSTNATAKSTTSASSDFQCVVYFWQGRDAGNMGWLTFTFSLRKKFEALFKDKLEVVRMYQQQENHKFLSHFKKKLVIRKARRYLTMVPGMPPGGWPELYHVRSNGSAICTRTIQVECNAKQLISGFAFVCRAPYKYINDEGIEGRVFIWIGKGCTTNDRDVARRVADEFLNKQGYPVEIIQEGTEPEEFWETLGGVQPYVKDSAFIQYSRMFRCTNEKGYFAVSEKTIDFCQDDLEDEDTMIVDTGRLVYLWLGSRASEVEVKLAYKAAGVYVQHLRLKQPDRPRKLLATLKNKEPRRFTKCFHAWGRHKIPAGD